MIIEGNITKLIYNKPNFLVFSIDNKLKVKSTINMSFEITTNMYVEVEGYFDENTKYGRTFILEKINKKEKNVGKFNILPYLINGIGDKKAVEIEKNLGENYLDVLQQEPIIIYDFMLSEKTRSILNQWKNLKDDINIADTSLFPKYLSKNIKGLGTKKAKEWVDFHIQNNDSKMSDELIFYKFWATDTANAIYEQVLKIPQILEVMKEIKIMGYNDRISLFLISKYKENTINELTKNPYIPISQGMDFEDCDEIALTKLNFEKMSIHRIVNGVICVLKNNESEGNTFMNINSAISETSNFLQITDFQFIRDIIVMNTQFEEPEFILKGENLYRRIIFFTERKISLMIKDKLNKRDTFIPSDVVAYINKQSLNNEQKNAVKGMILDNISILTGGPGTGKTTTINVFCQALKLMNRSFALCSPTGRASKRLSETTGHEAKTIHRLLEYKPMGMIGKFMKNEDYPLNVDYVIVDESSMLDVYIFNSLLKAIKQNTRLVLVGDVNQLPSVSMGSILRDLKDSNKIPVYELKHVYRQGAQSLIKTNAYNVKDNIPLEIMPKSDFGFKQISSKEEMFEVLSRCVQRNKTFQVLCPMKSGNYGVNQINEYLQMSLNPQSENKRSIYVYNKIFREGDRIIQLDNDYQKEVYNGEMGEIAKITDDEVIVNFPQNNPSTISYKYKELRKIDHAWAITIHKSQGSEFDNVVLIVDGNKDFLSKELIYTGMTRAKKSLFLLSVFDINFYSSLLTSNNRATNLKELLNG